MKQNTKDELFVKLNIKYALECENEIKYKTLFSLNHHQNK